MTCTYEKEFQYLDMEGKNLEGIERRLKLDSVAEAPVKKGDVAGKLLYVLDGKEIGSVDILFAADVEKAGYLFYLKRAWEAREISHVSAKISRYTSLNSIAETGCFERRSQFYSCQTV